MKIYCIGNDAVAGDSVPVKLLPFLSKEFPEAVCLHIDPSENFIPEDSGVLIDTVEGISAVRIFSDIDDFVITKSVSVHDYDLGFHLQLLKKLHKLPIIHIIAIPRYSTVAQVKNDVLRLLTDLLIEERKK